MNLLSEVINRLNQRIGVANIFDKQFGLCELNANGNEKAWIHYIGDGQGEVVTNFDAKQGTIFWAKRGKVNISIIDSLKVSGCKKMYQTTFPLTAYAVVRKAHLPCDSEDAQDWIASRVFKLTSGMDYGFKQSIGVMSYEVIPNGYANEIKSLTQNYEWACVSIDIDVQIVSSADDGCYDTCQTGEIPLPPDYAPCTPCLTEVAVDGVTITGNGTEGDPLVATGVTAGGTIIVKDEGTTISPAATTVNFTGAGVTASLTSPGVVEVNIPSASGTQVNSDWNAVSGVAEILNKPTIPTATSDLTNDSGFITAADVPAQIQSDWNQANNAAVDFIKNKPTINAGTVTSVSASVPAALSVTVTDPTTTPAIAITAAGVASQYIRGDGQLATLPSNTSGGSAVSYYLNGGTAASVATYYQMSRTAVLGANADFSLAGNGLISQWLTDLGDPNRLEIPAGNWNFEIFMSASSAGGTPAFYVELLKYDGAFTSIATSSAAPKPITGGTNIELYLASLAIPQTTLLVTDRLAIRVYIVNSTGGRTITMHTQDGHLCEIITNFAGGIAALNGLTANTQYFAAGTAGADFAISSSGDTHTFNLPTASAANRGALSSADWSTFNGKQDALSLTTTGTSGAATLTGATLNIPQYDSPITFKTTADSATITGAAIQVAYTQLITANTFTLGDIIRVTFRARRTGVTNSVVQRIYLNTTADLVGTPILVGSFNPSGAISIQQIHRHFAIKNATTNTEVFGAALNIATDNTGVNGTTIAAINWTTNLYMIFSLSIGTTDSATGSMYLIEKL